MCLRTTKERLFDSDSVVVHAVLVLTFIYAVCPGGEGAVLKTVGRNWLVGSNPMGGAIKNFMI